MTHPTRPPTLLVIRGRPDWAWLFHDAGWRVVWVTHDTPITLGWLSRYVGVADAVGGWDVDARDLRLIQRVSEILEPCWWMAVPTHPIPGRPPAWQLGEQVGYGTATCPDLLAHQRPEMAFFAANSQVDLGEVGGSAYLQE